MKKNTIILEIACFDAGMAGAITGAGADRIELCADPHEGGLTPSTGSMLFARMHTELPLHIMIRPRAGDFVYSAEEIEIMKHDIGFAKEVKAEGLVFGLLTSDGEIDVKNTTALIEAAGPLEITFHRAFDHCRDPFMASDELISLGIKRVLTSGQAATAPQGINLLTGLINHAGNRLSFIAGGGVHAGNAGALLKAGVTELHASAHQWINANLYANPSIKIGQTENRRMRADIEKIQKLKAIIHEFEGQGN